jgi:hypothetical protein
MKLSFSERGLLDADSFAQGFIVIKFFNPEI